MNTQGLVKKILNRERRGTQKRERERERERERGGQGVRGSERRGTYTDRQTEM